MSIKARLFIGFGLILLLMLFLTVFGIIKVNTIDSALTEITDVNSVKQRYAINFRGSVHDRAISIRDVAITPSLSDVDDLIEELNTLDLFYKESESQMQSMLASGVEFSAEELAILDEIANIQSSTLPLVDMIINLRKNDDIELAIDILISEARPAFSDWLAAINKFIDYQERANQVASPVAREVAQSFQSLMLIILACAIVVSAIIAKLISSSLYASLGAEPSTAAEVLSSISEGDLNTQIKSCQPNSMLAHMGNMQAKLSDIVKNILVASDSLNEQTEVVAQRSQAVTGAAKTQGELTISTTTSLDRMSDRLTEIQDIVAQTQTNSIQTTEFSKRGKEAIEKSSGEMERIAETVNSTVTQVRRLEDATKEIGNIVSVISSISEQTNLLALNAAIEAARAGETGRGFAVVADEVRQLAQRTGSATSQIESMIVEVQNETANSVAAMEKTQPLVESGKALTLETTELLQEIDQQAAKSMDNVTSVAQATTQQVDAIRDVANAMSEINTMSQDSITKLNENIEATQSLAAISEELNQNVKFFKV
jgi:methyl-accepting chemotaxis protein